MVSGVNLIVHPGDSSLLIDQKAHAFRPSCFCIVSGAISERDRAIGIAEQWKCESVLLRESRIRIDAVEAGAQYLDIVLVVVALMVAEPATFNRSSRCVCGWVKPQQHFAAPQIGEGYRSAVVRWQGEIGRLISSVNHRHTSVGLTTG